MTALTLDGSLRLVKSLARQNAPEGEEEFYAEDGAEWIRGVFNSMLKNNELINILPTMDLAAETRFRQGGRAAI